MVPFGKAGREFVQGLTRLFCCYRERSALECIALKVAMLFCTLLLQKPHVSASSKDIVNCLQLRLPLWKQGNIDDLVLEGRNVQHLLSNDFLAGDRNERLVRSFVSHMLLSNVCTALALLDTTSHQGHLYI